MAQDVTVAGAAYSDVPAVALPATGGGTAEFYDVSATTATAEDVASGKTFYSASGALTTGTASGGGGGSDPYPVRNDGNSHLWVVVDDLAQPDVTIAIRLVTSSAAAVIEWGDGATTDVTAVSGVNSYTHVYGSTGTKEIVVSTVTSAPLDYHAGYSSTLGIMGNVSSTYNTDRLVAVELASGRNVSATGLGNYLLAGCRNLEKFTHHGGGFTAIRNYSGAFARYTSLPYLRKISFVNYGSVYFETGRLFMNLTSLREVNGLPSTSYSRSSFVSLFENCTSLRKIPANIFGSKTGVDTKMFSNCWSLEAATIPAQITSIGANAFAECRNLATITFEPTTPPTVADANAWTNLPTTCEIRVPAGTLADYQAAANYPDPATYTYVEMAE